MQTSTIGHFPVILIGEGEWDGLLDWLGSTALADHRIDRKDLAGIHMAASPDDVIEIVDAAWEQGARAVRDGDWREPNSVRPDALRAQVPVGDLGPLGSKRSVSRVRADT